MKKTLYKTLDTYNNGRMMTQTDKKKVTFGPVYCGGHPPKSHSTSGHHKGPSTSGHHKRPNTCQNKKDTRGPILLDTYGVF